TSITSRIQMTPIVYVRSCVVRRALFGFSFLFFFNDPATTEIYTLSLHDALPIFGLSMIETPVSGSSGQVRNGDGVGLIGGERGRSEEHTSELQSQSNLVCRLLLEKKKKQERSRTS